MPVPPRLRSRSAALLLLLGLLGSARAQQPPPPVPPLPVPGPPSAPASLPLLPGQALPGQTPEPADVRLLYPTADVRDILGRYEDLSGKHVLYDNTVQGTVNIVVPNLVTRTEALRIIEIALSLNSFAIVPVDGNIVKVLGLSKPVRGTGLPIFTEIGGLPDSEETVTFLVRLHYLDPQEVSTVLVQYVGPSQSVGAIPLPKAGSILLTDTARNVRRLVNLITQLDQPSLPVVERFFALVRADATKAVEFLNGVFETKAAPGSGGAGGQPGVVATNANNVRRPIRRGFEDGQSEVPGLVNFPGAANPNGSGLSTLSGDQLILGRITITADVRTNRVHVVTSPLNLPLVERLLKEYDADTPFAAPVRYNLRFRNARDVLPLLVQALSEKGDEGANGNAAGGAANPNRTASNSSGNNNLFSGLNGGSGSGSNSNGFGGGGSGGSSSIGSSGLDTQPVDTTPIEATVGTTKLIADPSSNAIILLGSREASDKVSEILQQLDRRGAQVIIRTVIGELSIGDGKETGVNYLARTRQIGAFSQFNGNLVNAFGGTTTATGTGTGLTTGTGTTTTTGTGTTTGTATGTTTGLGTVSTLNTLSTLASGLPGSFAGLGGIIAVGKSFDIILSALDSTNRFKTVSRPMIFTQNNKKAIIASGQEIAVPTSQNGNLGSSVGGGVLAQTNIEYKNVTLQLEVVPLINSDHEITLDILQKIDSLVAGSSTIVNGTAIPTIATRFLKSTVSAPNNSTIVLGGLITQDDNFTNNAIPILGHLPIVGPLFSSRTRNKDRSELIILMHPEVVNTPPALVAAREREEDRTYLGPDLEHQILPIKVLRALPVNAPAPRRAVATAPK